MSENLTKDPSGAWTSISARELCHTKVLSLWSETARCERSGACNDFITFKCSDWVNVIAVAENGELVAIRQFRHGSGKMQIEIPGGCIDKADTDPIAAAARELMEETGFEGGNGRIIGKVCPNPALQGNFCYIVKFTGARQVSAPHLEDTEAIETFMLSDAKLKKLVREGQIDHGLVMDALLLHWLDDAKTNEKDL